MASFLRPEVAALPCGCQGNFCPFEQAKRRFRKGTLKAVGSCLAGLPLQAGRSGRHGRQVAQPRASPSYQGRSESIAGFAVDPGISPTRIAAAVGRPIRTYDVRPRVLAGKTNIPGAIVVRAGDLRRGGRDRTAQEMVIARSQIQPARKVPPPQALGRNENGRLGDNPPRAALGAVPGTIGAAPSPAAKATPLVGPAVGQQRREGTVPSTQPTAAQRPGQPSTTTGQAPQPPNLGTNQRPRATAAPPAPRDLNRGAEQRRGPARQENRVTRQATPRERAAPPVAARPQAPPPVAHQARPQAPFARVPAPQAPAAARAPIMRQQAPAARAPVPQAPAAQAPRPQPPSTTGAAPRGGSGPHEQRR
jgi:hypothetical protein